MKLEKATSKDADKMLSLSKEQMKCYFEENSLEWNEDERTSYLKESEIFRILSPDFSGYLQLCEKENELFIYDVQIIPERQGQGIGTKVVRRVFDIAKERGMEAVRLGSFNSNPVSELYKRLGFKIIKQNDYFAWYRYAIT